MTAPGDIRGIANYTYSVVASFIGAGDRTVRRWLALWSDEPSVGPWRCSYYDLSASFGISLLRRQGFSLNKIRVAHEVGMSYGITNILLHQHLCHDGSTLLFRKQASSDRCYRLDRRGIIEISQLIDPYLKRVYFDDEGWTKGMHPWIDDVQYDHIVVSPYVGFGYPVVKDTRIRTSVLASYYSAGDSKQRIVDNFGIHPKTLEQALAFEQAISPDLSG